VHIRTFAGWAVVARGCSTFFGLFWVVWWVACVCLMFWSETCAVFRKGWLEEDGCGR
jgi:hypothetical protein